MVVIVYTMHQYPYLTFEAALMLLTAPVFTNKETLSCV